MKLPVSGSDAQKSNSGFLFLIQQPKRNIFLVRHLVLEAFLCFSFKKKMWSSLVVRASDCQCTSCNGPGFDPRIRRHSGIWGAADEAVLNIVRKKLLKK